MEFLGSKICLMNNLLGERRVRDFSFYSRAKFSFRQNPQKKLAKRNLNCLGEAKPLSNYNTYKSPVLFQSSDGVHWRSARTYKSRHPIKLFTSMNFRIRIF
jgi:hypothetical protein